MSEPPRTPSPPPVIAGSDKPEPTEELQNLFASLSIDDEDSALIDALKALSKKAPKLVKSTEYTAPADPSIRLRSWKMNEFKYYDIPSPFPTLARGLFTMEVKTASGQTKNRIVARGYDKFFNIGEVPWTTWGSLESHTAPPYTLTLKSNGCIIFIAALTPSKLVVTSKHSLGGLKENGSGPGSHAQVGEQWLRKHLAAAGKTEEQLAKTLWDKQWTAVAELCDDSFEEHVLPYPPEKTGLHLHGLNACTKRFHTQDQDVVDAFAREWGFIVTPSTVLKTIPEVKEFTEKIGRIGSWNGEALEGFVVRTHVTEPPTKGDKPVSASPYPPGSSFFFKVKFDEPYMMYRDWREVTKTLLSKGPVESNVPKSKLRRPETKAYVRWVISEIKRDKSQFADFTRGKGIIATRERFLKWQESEEGRKAQEAADAVPEETGLQGDVNMKGGKTIIMPVAIPGVGKTTIAVALAYLFGFGHVQSDDIRAKKPAPVFIKSVVDALKTHDVVIADKNNHLKQHREQLREAAKKFRPPAKLLALNWSFDIPMSTVHRICGDRIMARGENHQSLVADETKSHEDVLWQFLKNAEELTDAEADVVVSMDVEEPLEDALSRAVGAVVKYLGLPQPDAEKMGMALAAARAYEPKLKGKKPEGNGNGDAGKGKNKKQDKEKAEQAQGSPKKSKAPPAPRYFGILAEVDLQSVVGGAIAAAESQLPSEAVRFWNNLVQEKRVQGRPHVTLVHSKSLPAEGALWERCRALHALPRPPLLSFRLGHVVWSERIMACTVVDIAVDQSEGEAQKEAVEFVVGLPEEVRERLHITVGTRNQSVPPVEAKELVTAWKKREGRTIPGVWAIPLKDVWVKGRVKGLQS
ncbi:RNA ligase-domain-containing protein [Cerioporus squamosus]|nr:RNA ligase-domain-containing protein [Cerioporus squamosus]